MKKLITLLLALVMCLSLAACGEKTQTVEITMDNWQEFFEINKTEEWHENDFGEAHVLSIGYHLSTREEYQNAIKEDSIDLTIECGYEEYMKVLDIDWSNRTFAIDSTYADVWDSASITNHFEGVKDSETGRIGQLFSCDIDKSFPEMEEEQDGKVITSYILRGNPTITRIKGSIEIAGEIKNLSSLEIPTIPNVSIHNNENALPETTAETNPTYEMIEITEDNIWQYFEITQTYKFELDEFDEGRELAVQYNLALKAEYQGFVNWEMSDFAVKMKSMQLKNGIEIDWKNKTFTLTYLDDAPEKEYDTAKPNRDVSPFYSSFFWPTQAGKYIWSPLTNPEDITILNIKGSLAFAK